MDQKKELMSLSRSFFYHKEGDWEKEHVPGSVAEQELVLDPQEVQDEVILPGREEDEHLELQLEQGNLPGGEGAGQPEKEIYYKDINSFT